MSWALLKKFHSKGQMSEKLKIVTKNRKYKYKAIIKKNNFGSIKSAIKAGFSKSKNPKSLNKNYQYGNYNDKDFYYFTGFSISYIFYKIPCPRNSAPKNSIY